MVTTRGKVHAAGAITGMLAVSGLVFGTTQAAFSDTTDNTGNSWQSGEVALTDNDLGNALFATSDMVPGQTETNCIEVTYTGAINALGPVTFYATVGGSGLQDDLDVVVREVEDCTNQNVEATIHDGPLTTMPSAFAGGSEGFTPTSSPETHGYLFEVTLGTDTPNSEQGLTGTADFTWEIRGGA